MSISRLMQMGAAGYLEIDPWTDPDLANASYDSVSFSVAGEDGTPVDFFFKDDGTKLYVCGANNDRVFQYTLSSAWDMSTASYDSVSFDFSSQSINPRGLQFKSDGEKMYVSDTSDNVYQYSLSTAWDLTTASYDSVSASVQIDSNSGSTFSSDGLNYYSVGPSDTIYQYNLSTAWDVSTATSSGNTFVTTSQEASPVGLSFNPDGTKMWVVGYGGDSVYQYSLSTAWNVSTASYDLVSFSVSSQDTTPYGIQFKSDGSKMYIIGLDTDTIYQYST